MTINALQKKYLTSLEKIYEKGEARAITRIVFEYFAGTAPSSLIAGGDVEIDSDMLIRLEEALLKLLAYVPPQQVIGETRFYGLKFKVSEQVLIPRPETEELVSEALNFLKESPGKKTIDIGTGSGCIAISIKKNNPGAMITAIDISTAALAVAEQNAAANDTEIEFATVDFLNKNNWSALSSYDLIISNPPYIPETEKEKLDKNVTVHEPHIALFVPENDPLIFYKTIFEFAETHLHAEGKIMLEVHEDFAKETAAFFNGEKYNTAVQTDINGNERMVIVSHRPKP